MGHGSKYALFCCWEAGDLLIDVSPHPSLKSQIAVLKDVVKKHGQTMNELYRQVAGRPVLNTENKIIPSESGASSYVDTTPIPSQEICTEMSKCFVEGVCGKDNAALRLDELAEVYPLAAAFRL